MGPCRTGHSILSPFSHHLCCYPSSMPLLSAAGGTGIIRGLDVSLPFCFLKVRLRPRLKFLMRIVICGLCACVVVLLSFSATGAVTQMVKVTVGRPRPGELGLPGSSFDPPQFSRQRCVDLIARCQPRPGSTNASPYGLVSAVICTQTDMRILKDGFRSFFSGHSSCKTNLAYSFRSLGPLPRMFSSILCGPGLLELVILLCCNNRFV